ncbi:uncharacterized protein LOC116338021 [Contarinia nasturtii]|uniref:uncharacterized protein LOC116338021 n=1 Tax=Contarinia nasturtii TaxID=265458 RepID=UPI0012D493B4|nr:uncharacterized protein LOC116338021 [Contarinia nasturtii]
MGNYCSSGQNKKDKDNLSQKSEDSPTYQKQGSKNKKNKEKTYLKEAPLVDPEPTSDISNFNAPPNAQNTNNGINITSDVTKPTAKAFQNTLSTYDSTSGSPLTTDAPCELPAESKTQNLPSNLISIYGKTSLSSRRTENDCKIVLYALAATEHKGEKNVLKSLYAELQRYCASRGFELQLCDLHEESENFLDPTCWVNEPLEARGGHHLAAECLSEITRYSNTAYIIPVLFLGTSLGSPLLPLTIESQDFAGAISTTAEGSDERKLLETWYILDDKAEPMCYRLKTQNVTANNDTTTELQNLYKIITDIFSKELRDSYLTTVIEQEINNMVFINQELSKRCIWIHTGALPNKNLDETSSESSIAVEMNRRLNNIQLELKNQLNDKNLIRIPPTVQISNDQLATSLKSLIVANIDNIISDHYAKFQIPYCTYGVDRNLLAEIEAVKQHSQYLSRNCANFEIMDKIKQYITTSSSSEPLIIYGPVGCGKSVLSAKVEHYIHTWSPECCFILRYAGLTAISSSVKSLVGSVTEQIYYYTNVQPYNGPHTLEAYATTLIECIDASKYQVVILIDSLDEALELDDLNWLPTKLNDKVKVIITTATSSKKVDSVDKCESSDAILWHLKDRISKLNFVHLNQFSDQKWNEVLSTSYGGGDFFSVNPQLQLPDAWKQCMEKIPLQAKLFWWFAWLGEFNLNDTSLTATSNKMFQMLECKFGEAIIKYVVSLLIASRDGLHETEIIELLKQSKLVDDPNVERLWTNISWIMSRGPILLQINRVRFMDNKLKKVACTRYANDIQSAHTILYQFYKSQPNEYIDTKGKYQWFNQQKFNELPYHAFIVDASSYPQSLYLTDLNWIQTKLKATKCVQCILNDIYLIEPSSRTKLKHLDIMQHFLETYIQPINYDADQFYPLFKHYLTTCAISDNTIEADAICKKWIQDFDAISISFLDILNNPIDGTGDEDTNVGYDLICNLGGNGYFVASLNTQSEEIRVWDVPRSKQVRILKGIPQPTALCPVANHGAAVLCRREIKVIDLNKGELRVTLKGVMNQKMPYFAYCNDAQHLVCLSRNRMYVNLMNLESGDCITTFKAGEDRFLNSLLVSGDGRILVCGDETQKPFPLLVWHLSQRKLLYDLRIPHHDFITSLSAITHEGAYVSVVTKELNEAAPNFIVVYDLQSGTLFKKWKPSCNTVSLSISQTNACVIAGLEDARILIWDLVTGNCKYVLVGHTAPVTLLKLDPTGSILLSADKSGRDRSVRLWELSTGKSIAVHTPPKKITTCEILPLGKYIVLALENEPNLVTLELKNCKINQISNNIGADDNNDGDEIYGDAEFNGKTFQL